MSIDGLARNCRCSLQEDQHERRTRYYYKPGEILGSGLGEVYKPIKGCAKGGKPQGQSRRQAEKSYKRDWSLLKQDKSVLISG